MNILPHRPTIALYQTLSPEQLSALEHRAWRGIEAGQGGEYFCYLKLQQRYAEMIARQWTVPVHGAGYVVRLLLPRAALAAYDLETVAYEEHLEYRVPVCELPDLGGQLVGRVELVSVFREQHSYSVPPGGGPLAAMLG